MWCIKYEQINCTHSKWWCGHFVNLVFEFWMNISLFFVIHSSECHSDCMAARNMVCAMCMFNERLVWVWDNANDFHVCWHSPSSDALIFYVKNSTFIHFSWRKICCPSKRRQLELIHIKRIFERSTNWKGNRNGTQEFERNIKSTSLERLPATMFNTLVSIFF